MNANELADKLMSSLTMEYDCDDYMEQAAVMLRQQQAEIEKLKEENAELQRLFDKAMDEWTKEKNYYGR